MNDLWQSQERFSGWRVLLESSLRCFDLLDSRRQVGSEQVGAVTEERPGESRGLFLAIGIDLIEYLHAEDQDSAEGWINLAAWEKEITSRFPVINKTDIEYVIALLSTRTTLTMATEGRGREWLSASSKNETRIIERPSWDRSNRVRLTQAGRNLIGVVTSSRQMLLIHHDAQRIVSAIELAMAADVERLCGNLKATIRNFRFQVQEVLQVPGRDNVLDFLRENQESLTKTMEQALAAIKEGSLRLQSPQVLSTCLAAGVEPERLRALLDGLVVSLERLYRSLSKAIEKGFDENREVFGTVRFDLVATYMLFNTPTDPVIEACAKAVAPWTSTVSAIAPEDMIERLVGSFESLAQAQPLVLTDEDEMEGEALTRLQGFIADNRAHILERLHSGPLSLSEAARSGWLGDNLVEELSMLLTVFASPGHLALDGEEDAIDLVFEPGGLAFASTSHRLTGDTLWLQLRSDSEATVA